MSEGLPFPRRTNAMARNVALLIGLVLLLWLMAWAFQRKLMYFPLHEVPAPQEMGLAGAEAIAFDTEDGLPLGAWFVPSPEGGAGVTAIIFNGNAGNRAYRAPLAKQLADRGMATLLFDYRGYGGNPGSPSEDGFARDARAARRYLASRPDVDETRIVYFGESLGAAVALNLALEFPPRALVLRSPFTSMADVGAHHYPFLPVRWLLRDRFPSLDRIRRLRCPVLVIAAEADSIVPSEQSLRLYEAAPDPKRLLVLRGTDHNDYELLAGSRMIAAIAEFVQRSR